MKKVVNGVEVELTREEALERKAQEQAFEKQRLDNIKEQAKLKELPSDRQKLLAIWDWVVHGKRELLDELQAKIEQVKEKYDESAGKSK